MHEAILFKNCLGLNDSKVIASQIADPKTGKTHLTAVQNMTVTDDGCIQTVPALETLINHTLPITRVSAGQRLFFSDDVDTYELIRGSATPVKRFPLVSGPMLHTPLDVRLSTGSKVYKSVHGNSAMVEALVGTNPNADNSVEYAAMPVFTGGFMANSRAFVIDDKFIRYSMPYHYDLFDLGKDYMAFNLPVLQAGHIPGVYLAAHEYGVTVVMGGDPRDKNQPMQPKFYPCAYEAGTLFSGLISKAMGYGHVFLCADGVYMVGMDGAINRLSADNLDYADELNVTYSGAVVSAGKYLAFGDQVAVEYDFRTKAVMKRASGVSSAYVLGDIPYLAVGNDLVTLPALGMDDSGTCSVTLPFSGLGTPGRKQMDSLYLTGEFKGDLMITLLDQQNPDEPERWTEYASLDGVVQNYRVKLPKGTVGSKVAFRFEMELGSMRVEEIRATFGSGQRR